MPISNIQDPIETLFYMVNKVHPTKISSDNVEFVNSEKFMGLKSFWKKREQDKPTATEDKYVNLQIGQTFKNYRELCRALGEEIKGGKAKELQLTDWQRFFKYTKNGIKFTITDIYEVPLKKEDGRSAGNNTPEYIKLVELLILDLLAKDISDGGTGELLLSKNTILLALKLINYNYSFCKQRTHKLSQHTSIPLETVEEWYYSADSTLKRNVQKALDNLRGQSLLVWSKEITVCEVSVEGYNSSTNKFDIRKESGRDDYGEEVVSHKVNIHVNYKHREATKEEKQKILYIERELLKELDCANKQELVRKGLWEKFKVKVEEVILKELNIGFYYSSYKIIFNKKHVIEEYKETSKMLLEQMQREHTWKILNIEVANRLIENAKKRHLRSKKEVTLIPQENFNSTVKRRLEEGYIQDNITLVKTLISKDSPIITKEIKQIVV